MMVVVVVVEFMICYYVTKCFGMCIYAPKELSRFFSLQIQIRLYKFCKPLLMKTEHKHLQ